jgi:hypothetical protein
MVSSYICLQVGRWIWSQRSRIPKHSVYKEWRVWIEGRKELWW